MPQPKRKAKPQSRRKPRKNRRKPRTKPAAPSQAIVTLPPATIVQGRRERRLTEQEIELLKRTVAKGCSNDEFAQFLWVAKKHKVDPFTRQIHAVKFWLNKHHQEKKVGAGGGEILVWVGDYQMVVMMGIDGYRSIAARHHKDYGGCDEATFTFGGRKTKSDKPLPDTASIRLWRKGLEHPIVATVRWDEFAPPLEEERSSFWNRMPCHMLAKVAESHALRKAYPDLADIYTDEEMANKLADYTDEGRLIVESDGRTPNGEPAARGVLTHRSAQSAIDAEIERQKKGEIPSTTEDLRAGTPGATPPSNPPPAPTGEVFLDWTDKANPILRGELAQILENLQKNCKLEWGKDNWWHFVPEEAPKIREICKALNYRCNDIFPATSKGSPAPAEKKPAVKKAKAEPKPPELIDGVVQRCNPALTGQGAAVRQVRIGNTWYNCYRTTIHEYLDQAGGKQVKLWIDHRKNIIGCKQIGGRMFEDDGATPIVQKNEPRGGNLFEQ